MEHSGKTPKGQIRDHKVVFEYDRQINVKLTVERNGMLQECPLHFEVWQDYATGSRNGEQIMLGRIKLNLSEFCDADEAGSDEGICRRYLMQDSKINSTLKVGISMRFLEGDRNYIAPELKAAPAFGGIARIMTGEEGPENVTYMPSLSTKSKEHHEYQDMYRRNLSAFWTAQPGELKADETIEDIFAGGDGWAKHDDPNHPSTMRNSSGTTNPTSGRGTHHQQPNKMASPAAHHARLYSSPSSSGVSGRASLEQHANNMKAEAEASQNNRRFEVDEFEIREDLKSWKVSEPAS
ncbi:MAG: hypothetical protein Q9159_003574 [Coniocarpon cinnabarinum]